MQTWAGNNRDEPREVGWCEAMTLEIPRPAGLRPLVERTFEEQGLAVIIADDGRVAGRIPTTVGLRQMAQRAAKLSVSVPSELANSVRKRVGPRGLSGFAARAMRHELDREQLGDYLAELDAQLGVVPKKLLIQVRSVWHKR